MIRHWLGPTLSALADILKLKEGWDSYGAPPIDPRCVMAALDFLRHDDCMQKDTPTPHVTPTSCGGLQLEWNTNGIALEVEFYPNGKVGCLYETEEWGESFDDGDVENLAALHPLVRKLSNPAI
jgi:hypothetical protein